MPESAERIGKKTIWLEIVTPSKLELRLQVEQVVVPTVCGSTGILPGHIRLVGQLDTGVLRYLLDGNWHYLAVSEGYLEVGPTKVIVLAEVADLPEEINVEEALAEKRRAEDELHRRIAEKLDFTTAQINLERSILKLQVAKKSGHYKTE